MEQIVQYDIYLITNKVNDKKYVGITSKGYEYRFKGHLRETRLKGTRYLCNAIRKYGEDSFTVELLAQANTHKEACELEREFIKQYKTHCYSEGSHGYNETLGGDGMDGYNISEQTRSLIRKAKKEAGAWVGNKNPNFGKGHLMSGEKHFNFGKHHSKETLDKISKSNKGRLAGENNHAAIKCVCFAKECSTGEIIRTESFYELRKTLESKGVVVNRSSCLQVIRGQRKTHKGYIFYREDITPTEIMNRLENEYRNKIAKPIIIEDHRIGGVHPNAKNELSFAKRLKDGKIFKFDSWYELKDYMTNNFDKGFSYSALYNVLTGKYKSTRGFVVYREDVTDSKVFADIKEQFEQQII